MSTIAVTNITTANGSTNLVIATGNTSAPTVVLTTLGDLYVGNNTSNSFVANTSGIYVGNTTSNSFIANSSGLWVGNTTSNSFVANTSGTYDTIGNVRDIVNSAKTAAYVLVASDNGKMINITTGGVTINGSIFSAGNNITIFNNSGSSQTITQGTSVTMYLAGTATTGNRTLAQRGICTVVCVAANTFVISGAGLT